jgi:hypothetical protein
LRSGAVIMRPAIRRGTLGFLFLVLLATAGARAAPVVADDNPITDTVSDATDPITDDVSEATDPITDSVSDATDPITDSVSDAIDPTSDTVSDATDPTSDDVSEATDRVSDTASTPPDALSTGGSGTTKGSAGVHTSSREENAAAAATGDEVTGAVERILSLLAQTGLTVLPWIAVAGGLTVLGIFLLRLSRHRISR